MINSTKVRLLLILIIFSNFAFGTEFRGSEADKKIKGAVKIITGKSDVPAFIEFKESARPELSKFDSWAHENLKLTTDYGFKLTGTEKDAIGMTHHRYTQTFKGIPVEGTMYIVHAKDNRIVSMNGELFNQISTATTISLTETAALNKALEYVHADVYRWENPANEKQIKQNSNNPAATWFPKGELFYAPIKGKFSSSDYTLTYRFDIYADKPLSRQYVFVSVQTGEIVFTVNRIHNANANGTAVTQYSGTRSFTTDSTSTTNFRLRETGRGQGIETYDLQQSTNYTNTDFIDTDNYWNNVNAALDEYATDAHWGAEMTYDFYQTWFNRNSIDGNGFKLYNYVHYGQSFFNAFWDGNEMTYGDGDGGTYSPLTSLDVAGHEITHGLTEFTSSLGGNEAGALNESFSDCMGNTIRYWATGASSVNWQVGDQLGGTPFRNMSDPNQLQDPDTYLGTYWDPGQEVHKNSTVMSYWYYLLTEGGSGTNDNGDNYNISGVGIDTAAAICYRMNTVYLFPNAEYADARSYAIQAAIDLYGPCTNAVIQTTNAWYAVGVGGLFSPVVISDFLVADSVLCSIPVTVNFQNNSTNAGYFTWDFGDGSPLSSATNPSHTYGSYGVYTVKLISDGATCGIDSLTKVNYINIDAANPCLISLPTTSTTGQTQNTCTGYLFDNGGSAGDYTDQTDNSITISPTGASSIQLTFSMFQLEDSYDYLYIYDGPSTASPQIGRYTGNTLPNGGTIASTGGSITIRMTTDQSVVEAGFAITWQCVLSNVPPTPAFTASATTTCSGSIQFTDNSLNGPTSWLWDFGDMTTSTQQSPSHTYTSNGVYSVTLTASNANGTNSVTQQNYITVSLPVAPTPGSGDVVCAGTSATLTASGNGTLVWYDATTGGNQIGTGTSVSTPAIYANTNFYVESQTAPASVYGAPTDNTLGNGGYYTNTTYRNLFFDVVSQVTLVSVKMYAQAAGNRTITLIQNGTTLQSNTVNLPAGMSRVTLNWNIAPGTDYEIGCGGNTNLYRNSSGAIYPYNVGGIISITGNNASAAGYYYYFYDWEIREPACVSARVPVLAEVSPAPQADFFANVVADSALFNDVSLNATTWAWDFGDPSTGANNYSVQQFPYHIYSAIGNYNACLIVTDLSGCADTNCKPVQIIQVGINENNVAAEITLYPNPANDLVQIQFGSLKNRNWNMKVTDVSGRILFTDAISESLKGRQYLLNTSSFAPGVYLIELTGPEGKAVKRLVKE